MTRRPDSPGIPQHASSGRALRITEVGEEVLDRPCREVTEFGTPELRRLVDDLFTTLWVAGGAGLAANQVGVPLRVFVWDCADEWGGRHVGHLVNPVLDETPPAARRLAEEPEGCLSVPGPYATVPRPDHAVARGVSVTGEPLVVEGHGYFARCLQHESDHLAGRLYLDRLGGRQRRSVLRESQRQREAVMAERAERAALLRPLATPPES